MEDYIREVYNLCHISAFQSSEGSLGNAGTCYSLKREFPFSEEDILNPDLEKHEFLMSNDARLTRATPEENNLVWLWGTGEAAQVISVSPEGDSLIQKVNSNKTEIWPAYAWTRTTPDMQRVLKNTSVRAMQTFFVNAIAGVYNKKLAALTGKLKFLAMNLLLRIAPQLRNVFPGGDKYFAQFSAISEDPVVLTAMALVGDQRWICIAKKPEDALLAGARAGRLFRTCGDGTKTVYSKILEKGLEEDSPAIEKALRLSQIEGHVDQSKRLRLLINGSAPGVTPDIKTPSIRRLQSIESFVDEGLVSPPASPRSTSPSLLTRPEAPKPPSPPPAIPPFPEGLSRLGTPRTSRLSDPTSIPALSPGFPAVIKTSTDSSLEPGVSELLTERLRAIRRATGTPDEGEEDEEDEDEDFLTDEPPKPLVRMQRAVDEPKIISLEDKRAELTTYGYAMAHLLNDSQAQSLLDLRASDRVGFNAKVLERDIEKAVLVQEKIKELQRTNPDRARFLAIGAGLAPDDIDGLAEYSVDPLGFRAEEKARTRAQQFKNRTGIETFEARRQELQRKLSGASAA